MTTPDIDWMQGPFGRALWDLISASQHDVEQNLDFPSEDTLGRFATIDRLIAAEIQKARIAAMEECLDAIDGFFSPALTSEIAKGVVDLIAAEKRKAEETTT